MRSALPSEDKPEAHRLPQEVGALDSTDPVVVTVLSATYALVGQFGIGLSAVETAVDIDRNSAWAWTRSGYLNHYMSRPDRAIERFEPAIRLSPLDPLHYNALFRIGAAHFSKGDYDEAIR